MKSIKVSDDTYNELKELDKSSLNKSITFLLNFYKDNNVFKTESSLNQTSDDRLNVSELDFIKIEITKLKERLLYLESHSPNGKVGND